MQKLFIIVSIVFVFSEACTSKINRKDLVCRHQVNVQSIDTLSSLTIGNGKFAFTVDFTGLQSFPDLYEKGVPLGTKSDWGWHNFPNPNGYAFDESLQYYNFYGREVPYPVLKSNNERTRDAIKYLRQNSYRLHLGIIGIDFFHTDGSPVMEEEISQINQTLNPWNGKIHSLFEVNGIPVEVTTYCHQDFDLVSAKIESQLLEQGLARVKLYLPYPSGLEDGPDCDWSKPEKHSSSLSHTSENSAKIHRQIESTSYNVYIAWNGSSKIYENKKHYFYIEPRKGLSQFSFSCLFTPKDTSIVLPDFKLTAVNNKRAWKDFWLSGGAVDFSESKDPRAFELERRVVLSQYLTKVQCSGIYPPQETGLVYNSWYGKFHLEMHWMHAVHFALWNRIDLIEKRLEWYRKIAPTARETARRQGYDGLRWPKMVDPSGNDSPSSIGPFLIWQQPHFIYLAELCYRNSPDPEFLQKYAPLVFETADFMASYAWYDTLNERYVLGPPLIPAQEMNFNPENTFNPPFELAYWHWGLSTAQKWRERLKLEPKKEWQLVIDKISSLPQKDGLYIAAESAQDSYTNQKYMCDHPMAIGVYGLLPNSPMIDSATMKNTFDFVWEHWQWERTWGWDFPMTAMAATRMGMPDKAVDALFMNVTPNTYLLNGYNYLNKLYRSTVEGHGILLTAIAMMCEGWEGSQNIYAPGFPKDGRWKVKWEGLKKLP